jgi:hypothetical protein
MVARESDPRQQLHRRLSDAEIEALAAEGAELSAKAS